MTVTIPAPHDVQSASDSENETCCTTYSNTKICSCHHDLTDSLLENLNSSTTPCETLENDIIDENQNKTKSQDKNGSGISEIDKNNSYSNYYCEKSLKRLYTYDEAPEYLKHNIYIHKGYRGILDTETCKESVFWWTNETINIWSHVFGLVLFISLTVYDLIILKIDAPLSDKILVGSILICFQLCMALSALYHTFNCRSEEDCDKFLGYDLFGIALSLYAIYVSGIYYAFWCDPGHQYFYLFTVTVIFIFAMILHLPSLNVSAFVRMVVFVAWAAYGVLPTIHWGVKMGGYENPIVQLLLPRVLGMYVISGTAFLIYITKIPERYAAGKFDFIGHSHQWWHFFVVGALYYWHNTGMLYVDYRLNHACANSMRIP